MVWSTLVVTIIVVGIVLFWYAVCGLVYAFTLGRLVGHFPYRPRSGKQGPFKTFPIKSCHMMGGRLRGGIIHLEVSSRGMSIIVPIAFRYLFFPLARGITIPWAAIDRVEEKPVSRLFNMGERFVYWFYLRKPKTRIGLLESDFEHCLPMLDHNVIPILEEEEEDMEYEDEEEAEES